VHVLTLDAEMASEYLPGAQLLQPTSPVVPLWTVYFPRAHWRHDLKYVSVEMYA
jgi:hypothetical protein